VGGIRQKQRELVRETIMQALAEHVAERGLFDFSVPEIAERAGVSHRTVYNYFENRQALLDALDEWSSEQMVQAGGFSGIEVLDDIPRAIAVNYRLFTQQRGTAEAFARLDPSPRSESSVGSVRRTRMILDIAQRDLDNLEPGAARALGGLLRHLASTRTWYAMTKQFEIADEEAADLVAWAAQALIAAAHNETGALAPSDGEDEG
jgi:AcrR family transcriptional regulator